MKQADFYVKELMSDECACGRSKKPRYSFCFSCYKSLPEHMQYDLWQDIGSGYEESYESAIKVLDL